MAKLQPEENGFTKPTRRSSPAAAHEAMTRLAYVADLLQELRDMAAEDGHATLCGLIAVAEAEARRCGRS